MSLDSLVVQSGFAGVLCLSFRSPDGVGLLHDGAAVDSRGSSCVLLSLCKAQAVWRRKHPDRKRELDREPPVKWIGECELRGRETLKSRLLSLKSFPLSAIHLGSSPDSSSL